jgi:hypothetical protein
MERTADLGPAKNQERLQLQERIVAFEQAWAAAGKVEEGPDLASLLPSRGSPLRNAALVELIKVDLRQRLKRRQPARLESYLATFPELITATPLDVQLIAEEFRQRQRHGDRPELEEYQTRFPQQFAELKRVTKEDLYATAFDAETATKPVMEPELPPTVAATAASAAPAAVSSGSARVVPQGYKLLERLGHGAFGEVWRAEAPGGIEVAVKVIFRPLQHESAQRELQALELMRRLHHPFLAQIHAYWALEDRLMIAMELADGNLRDREKACRDQGLPGISLTELFNHIREAAEALDYLQSQHVLHRDIKPDNILLLKGHTKVADFGLARLKDSFQLAQATTTGTPGYMAPEVWRGKVSDRSDQYSLAATYAELRLNRPLFEGNDMFELMTSHMEKAPRLDPLSAAEQEVLLRALAKEPEARFDSCLEFAHALGKALEIETGSSLAPPPPSRKWLAAAVLVSLLALAGLSGFLLFGRSGGSFALDELPPLVLAPGQKKVIELRLKRQGFHEPVQLTFAGLPEGVTMPELTLTSEAEQAELEVQVSPTAPPAAAKVTVHAEGGNQSRETVFELALLFVPAGFAPVDDKVVADGNGRKYYQSITRRMGDDGQQLDFVLIPKVRRSDPETFYMMKHKVSIGAFRQFAAAHPELIKTKDWDKEHRDALEPVLGITVEEAYSFASAWLKGNLPTAVQWDKASGLYEDNPWEGPYRGKWSATPKPRIASGGLNRPLKLNETPDDESVFGCCDMAGNGLEWTRTVGENKTVPLANPENNDLVDLRGKSYVMPEPLTFEEMKTRGLASLPYRPSAEQIRDVGFRVVIEP